MRRETIVDILARVDLLGNCWIWEGRLTTNPRGGGYGHTDYRGRKQYVHRIVYEALVGPIPQGLTLDHRCTNKACCNPDHLEPVTVQENILRSDSVGAQHERATHCPHGHEYDEANTLILKSKYGKGFRRDCRACHARRRAESRIR